MPQIRFSIRALIEATIYTAAREVNADEWATMRAARLLLVIGSRKFELVIARIGHAFSWILVQIAGTVRRTTSVAWVTIVCVDD